MLSNYSVNAAMVGAIENSTVVNHSRTIIIIVIYSFSKTLASATSDNTIIKLHFYAR